MASLYLESFGYSVGDEIETKISVIRSYPVLRRTAVAMRIMESATTLADTTMIVQGLEASIDVDQEGYANILVISATDTNPIMACNLANRLAEVYKQHDFEQKIKQARDTRKFVETQIFAARDSLAAAEEDAKRYREEHHIISMESQASVVLGQINEAERNRLQLQHVVYTIAQMLREIENTGELTQETLA